MFLSFFFCQCPFDEKRRIYSAIKNSFAKSVHLNSYRSSDMSTFDYTHFIRYNFKAFFKGSILRDLFTK